MKATDMIVVLIILLILLSGIFKKVSVTDEFVTGAKDGLKMSVSLLPTLILLMTAVGMFTASGTAELISSGLSGVFRAIGFDPECLTLALIRPVSGSGALAALEDLLTRVSPDSLTGMTACVLMASTETTFYTISVYYSALKKKPGSRIFIAAAAADITGFILSSLVIRLMFSR